MATKLLTRDEDYRPSLDVVALAIGVILVMFRSNRILYVRYISESICYGFSMLCFMYYTIINIKRLNRVNVFTGVSVFLFVLVMLYDKVRLGRRN